MTTEAVLRDWRFGQAQAERLAASLLHVEGYTDVDPQHPLGGPDGIKDALCRRGGRFFVAAAYFPSTKPTLRQVVKKFSDDFVGVERNRADGFCFFVNQYLTIGDRTRLLSLDNGDVQVEIYHLERMRAILDSPHGCGIRLEYLRIAMTEEEQFSFWTSSNFQLDKRLDRIEALQAASHEALLSAVDSMTARTNMMHIDLRQRISSTLRSLPVSLNLSGLLTARLDPALICWIHRLTLGQDEPSYFLGGQFRTHAVWVGTADKSDPRYTPPDAGEVPGLVAAWAEAWTDRYEDTQQASREDKIAALARFYYEFLAIHPFSDGNGRVADALLDQGSRELLQQSVQQRLNLDREDHYRALSAANNGDLDHLRKRITAALS